MSRLLEGTAWRKVNSARFHRLFYPQVPVVITVEFEGRIGGMPAIWHTPLSFVPPMFGVAIAPEHETYRLIKGARAFGVNWLDFSYADGVGELGEIGGRGYVNKLSSVDFRTIRGEACHQPLIVGASAILECRYSDTYRIGTHRFIVGRVIAARANRNFSDYWDNTQYHPLLYSGTKNGKRKSWVFRSLNGEAVAVPLRHQRIRTKIRSG